MCTTKRPNILFIMTDEQRHDCVGYINDEVYTPHLDKMSQESIVFNNAYTSNPSCIPARASIFTGRYPSQCGVPTYITYLPKHEKTFMQILREGGYYTACVGKQHFWISEIEKGYDYEDIIDEHCPYEGFLNLEHKSTYINYIIESGFTKASELFETDGRYAYRWKAEEKYHVDAYVGDRAQEVIKDLPEKDPWFLCVSFPGPHMPYDGIGLEEEKYYEEDKLSLPQSKAEDLFQKPPYYFDCHLGTPDYENKVVHNSMTDQEIRHTKKAYYAYMSLIDKKIGQLVDLLKEKNIYEDTLIIFTSDHGDFMGDYGMCTKAQYLSEGLMRIPFLIKPPIKDFKGYKEESFINSVEIAATCLKAAQIELPANIRQRSLTQFYEDGEKELFETMYFEARDVRGIRNQEWKLLHYGKRNYGELYNLKKDPEERNNLWNHMALESVKLDLTRKLVDYMIDLGENAHVPWNVEAPSI